MIVFNIKKCTKCKKEKSILLFSKQEGGKFGVMSLCTECDKKRGKKYYRKNFEKEMIRNKKYRQENKEKINEYRRNSQTYKAYRKKYFNNRYKNDPLFTIEQTLRRRLHSALKGKTKSAATLNLLGCSVEKLKKHLEKQFQKGMTWNNYGMHGWHIDHIIPCSAFDLSLESEQRKCFNYANLQPLWAIENIKKGDRII